MVRIRICSFLEVERHGEKNSDWAYKDAVIRAVPNSYSDVKFAAHEDHSFSLEKGSVDDAKHVPYRTDPLSATRWKMSALAVRR